MEEKEIIDALARSGYFFEIEIENMLARKGLLTQKNEPVLDKTTGKSREIDIHAFDTYNVSVDRMVNLDFYIECKNTKEIPVVLIRNQYIINEDINRHAYNGGRFAYIKSVNGIKIPLLQFFEHKIKPIYTESIYTQYCGIKEKGNKVKYATHDSDDNDGMLTLMQQMVAVEELIKDCEHEDHGLLHAFIAPIYVVNGKLYEAINGKDGIEIKEIDSGNLYVKKYVLENQREYIISITTAENLENVIDRFMDMACSVVCNIKNMQLDQFEFGV
jgi:hypothetical protein